MYNIKRIVESLGSCITATSSSPSLLAVQTSLWITVGCAVSEAVVNLTMVLYAQYVKNMMVKGCKLKHYNL
jgi:hypothetical protein